MGRIHHSPLTGYIDLDKIVRISDASLSYPAAAATGSHARWISSFAMRRSSTGGSLKGTRTTSTQTTAYMASALWMVR